ncbi:MAG: FtsX-like permease family protein [Chloroflexota bacterium]
MRHIKPRWRKMLRDLWTSKTRTMLVVLSLAVGVFTVSFMINTESLLRSAFQREYAAVNPSSATLIVPAGFDEDLVDAIRRMPEVDEAEGRRSVNLRLKVGVYRWLNLNLSAIDDFEDIRIDKVQPYNGAWPPAEGEILLERSSLRLMNMPDVSAGDTLTLQTASGDEATLKLAGIAYDFNRTPSPGTGIVYGFVTLNTLERLNEPVTLNDMRIVVAQNNLDEEYIRQVADQVKEKVEKSGRDVGAISVPEPGQHPLGTILDVLMIVLGALSVLTLLGGAFLVFNTIAALLAQQVRQIGIMKAIGGRETQIAAMYLVMILVFGLLALAITTPLAVAGGIRAGGFLADFFNLDLTTIDIPIQAFAVEAAIGLGVPFLAALYPIWSGTRVTVREAISDYGISKTAPPRLLDRIFNRLRGPFFRRPVLLSLRNTFRRRARLILTLLPLALSGAILLTVINVRAALMAELDDIFRYRNYNINVSFERPYRLAEIGNLALSVPGVEAVEGYRQTRDAYRLRLDGSRSSNLSVTSLSPATRTVRLPLVEGRWLAVQDQTEVVVNTAFLRDETDVRLGDRLSLKINGRKITSQVVGIVDERMAPASLYVNDSYFGKILGGLGRTSDLWVSTDQGRSQPEIKEELEAKFEQANMAVTYLKTTNDERSSLKFHFNIMIVPLGLAVLMLALVGGLGLSGTMTTNVMERSREVGVMRALGASDRGVQQIFIVEGLFIGALSWVFSVLAAAPLTYALDVRIGSQFLYAPLGYVFSIGGALTWLIVVLVTAALSCYAPAQNASQTSVRALLAYE